MQVDANRSDALMSELEALLASSRASAVGTGRNTVYASAHFTSAPTLEISSGEDDDVFVDDDDIYRDDDDNSEVSDGAEVGDCDRGSGSLRSRTPGLPHARMELEVRRHSHIGNYWPCAPRTEQLVTGTGAVVAPPPPQQPNQACGVAARAQRTIHARLCPMYSHSVGPFRTQSAAGQTRARIRPRCHSSREANDRQGFSA